MNINVKITTDGKYDLHTAGHIHALLAEAADEIQHQRVDDKGLWDFSIGWDGKAQCKITFDGEFIPKPRKRHPLLDKEAK